MLKPYFFYKSNDMPCKVNGCKEKHTHHYCRVCSDTDSSHFSRQCPKGTFVYHGTKKEYADLIVKDGFKASAKGRIGPGVYFTLSFGEAKKIAEYRFPQQEPVVIECRAIVQYNQFRYDDTPEEVERKVREWKVFNKQTAGSGFHPPWANNEVFKEVVVRDPKMISII